MKTASAIVSLSDMVPVNRQAAADVSTGIHFEPTLKNDQINFVRSMEPLPMVAVGTREWNPKGIRFGHFLVLGKYDRPNRGKWAENTYVVRCQCGWHETRTARAIKNPTNSKDCCKGCRAIAAIKLRQYVSNGGSGKMQEDFL